MHRNIPRSLPFARTLKMDLTTQGLAVVQLITLVGLAVVACQVSDDDAEERAKTTTKMEQQGKTAALDANPKGGAKPLDSDVAPADTTTGPTASDDSQAAKESPNSDQDPGSQQRPGSQQDLDSQRDTDPTASSLRAKRLVITSAIEDREPLPLSRLQVDETVTAFVEMVNQDDQDGSIEIVFEHESGEKVGFISLPVPGQSLRHRTWGRTHRIQKPGQWTAIVTARDGRELARQSFSVAESS